MRKKNDEMYKLIIKEIEINPSVTQKNLAIKYDLNERTIRRYLKDLKDREIIVLENSGINKKWKIL